MEFEEQLDLTFLDEALPLLQEYLLSKELYWAVSCGVYRLTPGNILLALARLEAQHPAAVTKYRPALETSRRQWRVAWEQKVAQETASRLRLWSQYLQEVDFAPATELPAYATEARQRTILQLLKTEMPALPEWAQLDALDTALRRQVADGEFIWPEVFRRVFAPQEFWFLYVKQPS